MIEFNREQWTVSKLGKEYIKAIYSHPVYLMSVQTTSWKITCWMNLKLETKFLWAISITLVIQMTPQERQEDKRKWRDSWGRWEKKVEKQDTNSIFKSLRSWHLFHHFKVYPWRQLNQWQILFSWPPMSLQAVNEDKKLIDTCPWMKIYDKSRHCIKKQRYYGQICSSQSYGFPNSHILGLQQEGYTKIECQCIAALQL